LVSDIKTEGDDVPVLDDIILAFQAEPARRFCPGLRVAAGNEIIVTHDFGLDKAPHIGLHGKAPPAGTGGLHEGQREEEGSLWDEIPHDHAAEMPESLDSLGLDDETHDLLLRGNARGASDYS